MKKVYVVGGKGFAKECYMHIMYMINLDPTINFGGFIGHNGYKVDFDNLNHLFVCDLAEFEFGAEDYAVIGAAYPKLREIIYDDIKKKENSKFFTIVLTSHSYLSPLVEYGEGNIFMTPCTPSVHVKIGNANVFNGDVIIGHDTVIGDFNFFGGKSQILGECKIGNSNTFGVNSILLPKAKIGNNNKIAPLSAVYKGCKNNCVMLGNPALKVGENNN